MEQNNYAFEKIADILEEIIQGDNLDINEGKRLLAEKMGLDNLSAPLFWRALIELLKEKVVGGIVNKEFIQNTLFDIIQEDIDYEANLFVDEDLLLSDFYIGYREAENFWNESINELIREIKELRAEDAIPLQNSISGQHDITSDTLKNADAANAFEDGKPLVIPYYNIDDKNYREIRSDNVKSKQNNSNKLQTTQGGDVNAEKIQDWLRLLMPQYGRRAELEDLNRNFWVIGQSLSAIGNYVFGKNPYSDAFENILKEIIQLWENIIHLWISIAISSQNVEKETHLIFYHLGSSKFENFTHFNNIPKITCKEILKGFAEKDYKAKNIFELKEEKVYNFSDNYNQDIMDEIDEISRLRNLSEQYANQKLCIIPIKRVNNYYKNYFSGEWYDYLYVHTPIRKEQEKYEKNNWKKIKIRECIGIKDNKLITDNLLVSPRYDRIVEYDGETTYRFTPFIFGVHTFFDNSYVYGYPFYDSENYTLNDENNSYFYCALRTKSEIDISITQDGNIEIKDFKIKVYDGYSKMICGEEHLIGEYFLIESKIVNSEIGSELILGFRYSQDCINIYSKQKYLPPANEKLWINNYNGEYLGEIPSWRNNAQNIITVLDEKTVENNAIFLKIGNFLPIHEEGSYTFAHTQNGKIDQYYMDFTRIQSNFNNNPFGFYSYYDFQEDRFKNYQILNDLTAAERPFSTEPNFISLQTLKQFSNLKKLNRDCIKKISDAAVRDFIIDYYSQDLRKDFKGKSCFFITGIGLAPTKKDLGNNEWEWIYNTNALCFAYHFIPNQKYLNYSNQIVDKNYYNAYNACDEVFLIENDEDEIGKIISCGEINGYDTFYDYIDSEFNFKDRMINTNNLYETDENDNKRKKLEIIFTGDKIELQKIKNEEGETISYLPNFEEDLDAKVIYYDLVNSDYATNRADISDFIDASVLQISQGEIDIDQFEQNKIKVFEQKENGAIKKLNGELFENRQNSCQKYNKNTALPFAVEKEIPFSNYSETIINDYNKYTDFDEAFYLNNYIVGFAAGNDRFGLYKKPNLYEDKMHIQEYWKVYEDGGAVVENCLIYKNDNDYLMLLPIDKDNKYNVYYKIDKNFILDIEKLPQEDLSNYNIAPSFDYIKGWVYNDTIFNGLSDRVLIKNGTYNGTTIDNVIISKKNFLNSTAKHCDKAAYYYFYKNIGELVGGDIEENPIDIEIQDSYKDLIVFHNNGEFILEKNGYTLSVNDKGIEVRNWEDVEFDIAYEAIMHEGRTYFLCQYVQYDFQDGNKGTELWCYELNKDAIEANNFNEELIKQILKNKKVLVRIINENPFSMMGEKQLPVKTRQSAHTIPPSYENIPAYFALLETKDNLEENVKGTITISPKPEHHNTNSLAYMDNELILTLYDNDPNYYNHFIDLSGENPRL